MLYIIRVNNREIKFIKSVFDEVKRDSSVTAWDMAGLTEAERLIVWLRSGVCDGQICTLQNLGDYFSVSKDRIRNIEARAVRRLATYLKVKI